MFSEMDRNTKAIQSFKAQSISMVVKSRRESRRWVMGRHASEDFLNRLAC